MRPRGILSVLVPARDTHSTSPHVITQVQHIYRDVISLHVLPSYNGKIIIFNWVNLNRITPINPRPDAPLRCALIRKVALHYEHYELLHGCGKGINRGSRENYDSVISYAHVLSALALYYYVAICYRMFYA